MTDFVVIKGLSQLQRCKYTLYMYLVHTQKVWHHLLKSAYHLRVYGTLYSLKAVSLHGA